MLKAFQISTFRIQQEEIILITKRYISTTSNEINNSLKNNKTNKFIDLSNLPSPSLNEVTYTFQTNKEKEKVLKPHQYRKTQLNPNDTKKSKSYFYKELNEKDDNEVIKEYSPSNTSVVSNNFETKGVYQKNQKYYKEFFRDRDRTLDDKYLESNSNHASENDVVNKIKQHRISPKNYWYNNEYLTPNIQEISTLPSRKLKFILMNETRKIRLGNKLNTELWDALRKRVTRILRTVHLRTLLRFLYCYASIKIFPDYHIKELIIAIHERKSQLQPKHHVMILQAFSRLNLKDINLLPNLVDMALCWSFLKNNFLIKASNSLSRLNMGSQSLCKPLIETLSYRIRSFTGRDCYSLKWITIVELFNDDMIIQFLKQCELNKAYFKTYTRNLQVIELYLRLIRNDLYNSLPESTCVFLETCRKASSTKDPQFIKQKEYHLFQSSPENKISNKNISENYNNHISSNESYDKCHENESLIKNFNFKANINDFPSNNDDSFEMVKNQQKWSSKLHYDLSKTLTLMKIEHFNCITAGPFQIDIYFPNGNFIIESAEQFQYYCETDYVTSTSRRRQEIISAMGFNLIFISYLKWQQLNDDSEKINFLNSFLPSFILYNNKSH